MAHKDYRYNLTYPRRMLLFELADGVEDALRILHRFTLLPIPADAIDAIFNDFKYRGLRGQAIVDIVTLQYQNKVVHYAAETLCRIKGDTYVKPLFARKPIY